MSPAGRTAWLPMDDQVLISLRWENPRCTWEELMTLFNSHVPIERSRSADAIKNRMNKLSRAPFRLATLVFGAFILPLSISVAFYFL